MRSFVAVVLCLAVAACASFWLLRPAPVSPGPQKLQLVATVFPLADWLREIGGPDVEVYCLVSGGYNPHHFEPTIRDATRVTQARALFAVGLGLDEWAARLARNSGRGAALAFFETGTWITPRPFASTTAIPLAAPRGQGAGASRDAGADVELVEEHHHGGLDPHYWLDPQRAAMVVARMAEELGKLDPPHREAYQQRAAAYIQKLKELDAGIEAGARALPPGAQVVTFHNAYGYLLDRLGVKLAAVVQASPGVEPSTRDVSAALRVMREIGQRVVFQEPLTSEAAAKTLARELGARVELLDPLDSEYSSAAKTYLERVRHDVDVLAKALANQGRKGDASRE
ncbi:MAG: metal ABC transporter substrate-binding protein [Planctomycetota bacterium]|nr:metal ABC transporter substrate-binding protein [Planctomycetota bacterium]